MGSSRSERRNGSAAGLAILLVACSPTFDWREHMAEGTGLVTSFPCRPDRHSRSVGVGGTTVRMEMLVCNAGGATFAVNFFDAADAPAVEAGLASLRTAVLENIRAGPPRQRSLELPGMIPTPSAVRLTADGRGPEGRAIHLEAAFFARGLRVYQAAIVGPPLTNEAVDPFFEGLKLPD